MPLSFPLNNQERGSIENAQFKRLDALEFRGGFPIFTSNRDITTNKPRQREMWYQLSGTKMLLLVYYNGTQYVV